MQLIYKGQRYRTGKVQADLIEFVEAGKLHSLDFIEALQFYMEIVPHLSRGGLAYLGSVDRFFLLADILGRHDILHPWLYDRCREVELAPYGYIDLWSREHYKAVDLDELVPTPTGFVRHGDLKPGDWVFGSTGQPVKVVATTPVFTDADCYRVTFDDGYAVTVSGQHLWGVERRSTKRVKGAKNQRLGRAYEAIDTATMASVSHTADDRLAVRVAPPVMNIEHMLAVSPYLLGAWLGDGHSAGGRITCAYGDVEIIEHIKSLGHTAAEGQSSNANTGLWAIDSGVRGRKGTGLSSILRKMGLINNKHIPRDYLVASECQRLELLRGLMDTDGHCNTRGTAIFVNKSKQLAEDVFVLAASLGFKPRLNVFAYDHGDVFHVSFQAYKEYAPFRLARKVARCKDGERCARRFVVSVERVETIPVSCIQVDATDGLYLIGKNHVTTHNSTIITFAGAIQEIVNDPEITIGIFSHTRKIAKAFVKQIRGEFERNERFREVYADICWPKVSQAPLWTEDAFTVKRKGNPKEATVEGWGLVDGQPTSKHFKLRKYDDVVTLESVNTPDQIKKTTEAWEMSDNLGAQGGQVEYIGTRYNFADTYADILDRGIATPRIYPATHNGKPDGKPVFLPEDEWEKKKKTQRSTLAAQMLQNPLADKEQRFEPQWFRPWITRPATMNVYILGDPSRGRTSSSDRTAIAVIGLDAGGNKYLLDGFCHRMTLSQRWDHLKHLHKKWSAVPGVGMVKVGYERFGQQSDDEYFTERMRAEKYVFSIQELAWPREGGASKVHRVERLQPDFEFGSFFLPGLVHVTGVGTCIWSADLELGQMNFRPMQGELQAISVVKARGQEYLACKPLKRQNEDGDVYDLTRMLMYEMLFFPFATHDDLVDATSRIYDIEPVAPSIHDEIPELPAAADA